MSYVFSVLRGIRFPGAAAVSHYLINYSFGFTKRSLIGSILKYLDYPPLYTYQAQAFICIKIALLNCALLLRAAHTCCRSANSSVQLATLIFCASPAIVYLFYLIGYHDHIGLLFSLLLLQRKNSTQKLVALALLFPVLLLLHEGQFIIFYPLLASSTLYDCWQERKVGNAIALGILSIAFAALVYTLNNRPITQLELFQMYDWLRLRVNYPIRMDVIEVLTRSPADNIALVASYWQKPSMVFRGAVAFITTLPALGCIVYALRSHCEERQVPRVFQALLFASSIAPLSLYYIGTDVERWCSLSVVAAFLALYYVHSHSNEVIAENATTPQMIPTSGRQLAIFALCLLLSVGGSYRLFTKDQVQDFPFRGHLAYLTNSLAHGAILVSFPKDRSPAALRDAYDEYAEEQKKTMKKNVEKNNAKELAKKNASPSSDKN